MIQLKLLTGSTIYRNAISDSNKDRVEQTWQTLKTKQKRRKS